MCGIVGYIGHRQAYPILIKGLQRLEYRGYDSAGIALLDDDIMNYKRKGKVADLEQFCKGKNIKSTIGIGHTRWATHGVPNDVNAHPHYSQDKSISIIHNGIIENYASIKKTLETEGYVFTSQTDTEVLPHLFNKYLKKGYDFLQAGRLVLKDIKGAFAFVAICLDFPDQLFVSRNSSPLTIGLGEGSNFVGSDAQSINHLTNKIIYLEDGDYALIKVNNIEIFDKNSNNCLLYTSPSPRDRG